MPDFEQPIQQLEGANPHPLFAGDWTRFGDMMTNDLDVRSLTYDDLPLKIAIKEMGGISAFWRKEHPQAAEWVVPQTDLSVGVLTVLSRGPLDGRPVRSRCRGAQTIVNMQSELM